MLRDGANIMITEDPDVKRYAIVKDGVCQGVTLWNGDVETWIPPQGAQMLVLEDSSTVSPGWAWDGETWTAPPPETNFLPIEGEP